MSANRHKMRFDSCAYAVLASVCFASMSLPAVAQQVQDPAVVTVPADQAVDSNALTAQEIADMNGDGFSLHGEGTVTGRFFTEDALYYGQSDQNFVPMLSGKLKFRWLANGGKDIVAVDAFGRWDDETDTTLVDLPEAYYQHVGSTYDFLIGSHTVFWGVAESYNPVNIINQKDNSGDIRGKTSLGQPMANLNLNFGEDGTFSFYALMGFRERPYGDRSSRFRSPWYTDEDQAHFEDDGDKNLDFAARYFNTFNGNYGSLDVGISYFNGVSRDPVTLPACTGFNGASQCSKIIRKLYEANINIGSGSDLDAKEALEWLSDHHLLDDKIAKWASKIPYLAFQPYYQHVDQIGTEFLYSIGNLQAKFEGAWRWAGGESYLSSVSGLEYTISNFAGLGWNVGLIGEYLYDNRSWRQPFTLFDNDVFGGIRASFNDPHNTNLLAGMFYDLDTAATIGVVEFSTRLTDNLSFGVSANIFNTDGWTDPLAAIANDSYVDVKLTAYF